MGRSPLRGFQLGNGLICSPRYLAAGSSSRRMITQPACPFRWPSQASRASRRSSPGPAAAAPPQCPGCKHQVLDHHKGIDNPQLVMAKSARQAAGPCQPVAPLTAGACCVAAHHHPLGNMSPHHGQAVLNPQRPGLRLRDGRVVGEGFPSAKDRLLQNPNPGLVARFKGTNLKGDGS